MQKNWDLKVILLLVTEELDKASDYYEFDEQGMEHVQMLRLVDAIEIVKGGGVDG